MEKLISNRTLSTHFMSTFSKTFNDKCSQNVINENVENISKLGSNILTFIVAGGQITPILGCLPMRISFLCLKL